MKTLGLIILLITAITALIIIAKYAAINGFMLSVIIGMVAGTLLALIYLKK